MPEPAFQDLIPDNRCFGCGPLNPAGLQIKSRWAGEESVCEYTPLPHHMAGPAGILNGGIIATAIDCHCVCTAIALAYRRENRSIGSDPAIWCATGRLDVHYLRPTPLGAPIRLLARVLESTGRKTILKCTLSSGGAVCVQAEVVAVQVPAEWRHGGQQP